MATPSKRKAFTTPLSETRKNCPEGYPRLAVFQSSDRSWSIYRNTGYLHARVILGHQDELRRLEEELNSFDQADLFRGIHSTERSSASLKQQLADSGRSGKGEPDPLSRSSNNPSTDRSRKVILDDLKACLQDYHEIILLCSRNLTGRRYEEKASIFLRSTRTDFGRSVVAAKKAVELDSKARGAFMNMEQGMFSTAVQRVCNEAKSRSGQQALSMGSRQPGLLARKDEGFGDPPDPSVPMTAVGSSFSALLSMLSKVVLSGGSFARFLGLSTFAVLVQPTAALDVTDGSPKVSSSTGTGQTIAWVVAGLFIGGPALGLAGARGYLGAWVTRQIRSFPFWAMLYSSLCFFVLKNSGAIEAKVAWVPFVVWSISLPVYVRGQIKPVAQIEDDVQTEDDTQNEPIARPILYMLCSAVLTGILICIFGSIPSLTGGMVTVLPGCAVFSVCACAAALRARVQWYFSWV